jgi:transposase
MAQKTALSELRDIRAAQRRYDALVRKRDELIERAVLGEGHSERAVAEAAGLSPGRINQIVNRDRH